MGPVTIFNYNFFVVVFVISVELEMNQSSDCDPFNRHIIKLNLLPQIDYLTSPTIVHQTKTHQPVCRKASLKSFLATVRELLCVSVININHMLQ